MKPFPNYQTVSLGSSVNSEAKFHSSAVHALRSTG